MLLCSQIQLHFISSFPLFFGFVNVFVKTSAELRTMSLCESDFYEQMYKESRKELSFPIRQRQAKDQSNSHVNLESNSSRFLAPPAVRLKSSLVNRSKSFQETDLCRRLTNRSFLRRNFDDASSTDDRFETISYRSSTPISSLSVTQFNENIQSVHCDNKNNDPFLTRILRRLQNLSKQWRRCKRLRRGSDIINLHVHECKRHASNQTKA